MAWVMRRLAQCDVCGHEWRAEGYPKRCAKCKASGWNKGGKLEDPPKSEPEVKPVLDRSYAGPPHRPGCRCYVCKPPKE